LDFTPIELNLVGGSHLKYDITVLSYLRVTLVGVEDGDRILADGQSLPLQGNLVELSRLTRVLALSRGAIQLPLDVGFALEHSTIQIPAVIVLRTDAIIAVSLSHDGKTLPFDDEGTAIAVVKPDSDVRIIASAPRRLPKVLEYRLPPGRVVDQHLVVTDLLPDPKWLAFGRTESTRTTATVLTFLGIGATAVAFATGAVAITLEDSSPMYGWVAGGTGLVGAGLLTAGIYLFASNPAVDKPLETVALPQGSENRRTRLDGASLRLGVAF